MTTRDDDSIRGRLQHGDEETKAETIRTVIAAKMKSDRQKPFEILAEDLVSIAEEDGNVREGALVALQEIAALEPEHVTRLVHLLETDPDPEFRGDVVAVFREVANRDPDVVAPAVEPLVEYLASSAADADDLPTAEDVGEREAAIARSKYVDRRCRVPTTLANVGEGEPDHLLPVVDDLLEIGAEDESDAVRTDVLSLLASLAEERPEPFEAHVETIGDRFAAETADGPLTNVSLLLAVLAEEYPTAVTDIVAPAVDDLFEMLEADAVEQQNVAVGLLAYLAEERPSLVEPEVEAIGALLEHDEDGIRGNAIWTLRYLDTEAARSHLETAARNDPVADLRDLAAEADGVPAK